ncbi:putative gypsy-type retrotransposon protein [Panicum miliaceum]|uniref:Gypsy-type retrotransposon protein n=1 Tax=Panicum miliaceum TaxID=4540 RepID=A0A3L6SW47_PANMI|nr:putative gypsy-type retrotransposon protein [Panicum miliaceum]
MRTKSLVTFHLAMPKKQASGRGKKRGADGEGGSSPPSAKVAKTVAEGSSWRASTLKERDLLWLVAERILEEEGVVQWRTADNDSLPWENTGETVMFVPSADRGLDLPSSNFFRGLLGFYKIKYYHLPPNLILHISIFVHLCEAFLGIRPHFHLFRHLFRLKPQPEEDNPALVGGAGVQLRDKALYLEFSTLSSLSGWHAQWFYIGNHKPSLPGWDNAPPQH